MITAIGVGGCPSPNFPELITGIRIEGTGCSILKIADVAYEQGYPIPQNIPEMTQGFDEPFVEYGSIVSAPVPSLSLVNPLIASWQHDTMDNSVSDPVTNSMSVEYETVHYSRGAIGKGGPKGFAEEGPKHINQ